MGPKEDRSRAAALLGRRGGPARAKALTAARRSEIAKQGAATRWGHAPGHLTTAFYAWLEDGGKAKTVEVEINYQPTTVPIEWLFGKLWNCTDIVGGTYFQMAVDICGHNPPKRSTLGAVVRALKEARV